MHSEIDTQRHDRLQQAWNDLRDVRLRHGIERALQKALKRAHRSLVRKGHYRGSATTAFYLKDADRARFHYRTTGDKRSFEAHATKIAQEVLVSMGVESSIYANAHVSSMNGCVYVNISRNSPASR